MSAITASKEPNLPLLDDYTQTTVDDIHQAAASRDLWKKILITAVVSLGVAVCLMGLSTGFVVLPLLAATMIAAVLLLATVQTSSMMASVYDQKLLHLLDQLPENHRFSLEQSQELSEVYQWLLSNKQAATDNKQCHLWQKRLEHFNNQAIELMSIP